MFTLTESLASPGATSFKTDLRNVKGRTECLFEVFLHVCIFGRKMAHIAKSIRATIDYFLCTPPHNKLFSNISDQAKKLLVRAFVKGLRKTGIIAGVVHTKPINNEQMRKLFNLSKL